MLFNLPYHIMDSIQLGNEIIKLVATSKANLPNTFNLFRMNLKLQKMNEITDYYDHNDIRTIIGASYWGYVSVLEWWKSSGLELKYDSSAIDLISCVHILEWWKNSGLKLRYSKLSINFALIYDQISVLEWWKNSGLEIKYDEWATNYAFTHNKISVLEWLKNSGLELKYDKTNKKLVEFFTK